MSRLITDYEKFIQVTVNQRDTNKTSYFRGYFSLGTSLHKYENTEKCLGK